MKPFQQLLVAAPAAALLPVVLAPASSLANDVQLNLDTVQGYSIAQATTIRDFSDVYPTDWAYQALSELVETYGCVSGFGDGTFRGNQPMTRFQMAAVLSSCLDSISAKMDMMGEEMSAMEDMETLERLVASFEEELITLKGSVDGLDAKVSELEDSQFSTTTKASFEIATDFTYFASGDDNARALGRHAEDNSGLVLTSEAEVAFETSFTGSDKLSFSITGDLMSKLTSGPSQILSILNGVPAITEYLASGDFYGAAGDEGSADFNGFSYETTLDMGGMMTTLVLGTDFDDFDPIIGLDTYYGGDGYDDFGPSEFGDAGIGFNIELLSSDAGALTASASYAVANIATQVPIFGAAGDDGEVPTVATAYTGPSQSVTGKGGIFGENTHNSGVLALSWEGALFGGNDALFTTAYQNIRDNTANLTSSYFHFVLGAYFTDTLSLSGSYSVGNRNPDKGTGADFAKWMIALNMDDAIFPGNSAGIAYGTPEYSTDETDNVMQVVEVYYTFSVNDNFEIPIYLDFISNVDHRPDANAFAIAVRPTLTF